METATFGAGCFWGIEETYRTTPGVIDTAVGYSGGTLKNPTYEDVCSDSSGHAEVVELHFDPAVVSYDKLLDIFWENHNRETLRSNFWLVPTPGTARHVSWCVRGRRGTPLRYAALATE